MARCRCQSSPGLICPGPESKAFRGMKVRILSLSLLLLVASSGCQAGSGTSGYQCIAPANPGGGWDLACRLASRAFTESGLIAGNIQVVNLPGAGGGRAFVQLATRRRSDPGVFVAASPATTLNLAQERFGSLEVGDVRWVAALAAESGVLAVRADAPWRSLEELMAQWRADPSSIVTAGGSAVASQDHVKVLLMAEAGGIDPLRVRYVPFDGGGEALAAVLGGFVDLFSGDVSEVLPHMEAGSARILTVMSRDPLSPPLDELPTTFQAGYPVAWPTWRGFYIPGDVPDSVYEGWSDRFLALGSSQEWGDITRAYRWEPFVLVGPEFETFVKDQVGTFRGLARRMGLIP